ncbi:MAG: hybrid sensor histidine kinase/response regulator [Sandaracinus sp.]|nr:hybrid sensor histidine kinase/response regulator [Sandaracinus sp.]MCB9616155.1 hybrid sensor histidine kinase/response regulator [Sandaracinus sp.]MCB9617901.1 hybrid sensor histidine kinase/response regulator [Sandaracinus sp.]MCB9623684.1 hybrid sensor histidine kinase/response regulator [Sandaracinus sp.]MCB9634496.1 hybrid sensor histidine kinase/response regulator [Sandaracinus sp.]
MSDARPLILYVDDEEANRQTFRFLYEEQLHVAVASSGEEALARLDELAPAVLVADQRMPGMSGSELCAQVRMRRPDTLRIILTAYADANAAVDAINRGAVHAYFHKPYNEEELRNRLIDAVSLVVARREVAALEERLLRDVPERVARAMAAEIAHELGNVLTGLGLSAQVLGDELTKMRDAVTGKVSGSVERCIERSDHVLACVEQLVGFTQRLRDDGRSPEHCEPHRVLRSTARLIEPRVRGTCAIVLHGESEAWVPMAASALGQVLINVVLNAAQAIEESGRDDGLIDLFLEEKDDGVVIRVVDDGPGIPADLVTRVFEPRFTTRDGGSGLGLDLTRRLVEDARGRIEVQSRPGRTEMAIWLPRENEPT